MPGSGERAYVYAKACGIMGKSFIGKRISALGSVTRLSELDRMVFPRAPRDLPERELLVDLERRIIARAADQIFAVVDSFSQPPEFLVRLLRSYEYGDLGNALNAVAAGESSPPGFTDLGRFRTVSFEAYPRLDAMVKNTEFAWLLKEPVGQGDTANNSLLQTRLDQQYYSGLWESMIALAPRDRVSAKKILSEEISLRNVVWALRMRTYYEMPPEEVRNRLVFITGGSDTLAADAAASLDLDLTVREAWRDWKRAAMLNPEQPGVQWRADPRYFQNAAAGYLYRLTRQFFRRSPFSLDTVFCFIKLKQFEEDLLTNTAEGLGLGMAGRDVFSLLEVRS
jgi:vacuolar-type H+-ATPase subunit C/Vma6